jgi:predicted dehydrogenase
MKICIVGYGSIGKRHHRTLLSLFPDSSFDIIDVNTSLTVKECQDRKYNILVICTPSSSHLEVAAKFSKIKDLIFIEKPLDISTKKIEKYLPLVDNKKVHVGCNLRFTEAYREFLDVSKNSKIINITSMSYLPMWRNIDHKKTYSSLSELGGGALLDFIHEPDYVFSAFGLPDKCYISERRLFDITVDSNDTCSMIWEYSDRVVNFLLSYGSKEYIRHAEIIDEESHRKVVNFSLDDINASYEHQWKNVLNNGPVNTYADCLNLYHKIGL